MSGVIVLSEYLLLSKWSKLLCFSVVFICEYVLFCFCLCSCLLCNLSFGFWNHLTKWTKNRTKLFLLLPPLLTLTLTLTPLLLLLYLLLPVLQIRILLKKKNGKGIWLMFVWTATEITHFSVKLSDIWQRNTVCGRDRSEYSM
jgi:hypothetical protein